MGKNNNYRKLFRMDEFGRRFYCKHARLNLVRSDKKQAKKKVRCEEAKLLNKESREEFVE